MATIILRQSNVVTSTGASIKGAPLTNAEVDNNFANLNVAVNFVTYAVGNSGNVLTSNGTFWSSQGLPASGLSYVAKSANYTIQNNEGVLSNTALGSFTITLPSSPAIGNQVVVADSFNSWSANNLTIARNGSTIENLAENLVCDISGTSLQLVYSGNTWDVFASTGIAGGSGVTLNGIETLTNKTLTAPTLNTPFITNATLAGTPQAVTATSGTSNTMVATTAFVNTEISNSPTITSATLLGTTQAVTAANGTSNAMVATTAFVNNEIADSPVINTPTINSPNIDTARLINFGTIRGVFESGNVVASAPGANVFIDLGTSAVQYFTSNASTNFTVNFRANSTANLNSVMNTGNTVSSAIIVSNGGTAYYPTVYQVDGAAVTPKWQTGTAPTGGNASSTDVYVFTIVKTASATFTVLASQTKFA